MKLLSADRGTGEPISLAAALITGKKVPPDVIGLLKDDHRVVLGWFDWYRTAGDADLRERIARKICTALRAHMAAEEEILYPAARRYIRDDQLVKRALDDHDGAKELIDEITETSAADERHQELLVLLEEEIRAHVEEEETELMPQIQNSELDVYEVGAAVAARRVDALFVTRTGATGDAKLTEFPAMQISEDQALKFYIVGLKNQHAMAKECQSLVKSQLERLENYPTLRAKLEEHLPEKEEQIDRIERILERLDDSPSTFKDVAMKTAAAIASIGHSTADDEIIKNSFATLAMAKYEAAAYETLILFGQAAGDSAALPLLQQSLSEERAMAAFIESNLRPTGMRFLQLRSEGADASH